MTDNSGTYPGRTLIVAKLAAGGQRVDLEAKTRGFTALPARGKKAEAHFSGIGVFVPQHKEELYKYSHLAIYRDVELGKLLEALFYGAAD